MFLVGKLLSNKQTYKIWLFMWLLQVFFAKCCIFNLCPFWGNFNPRNTGCGNFFSLTFCRSAPPVSPVSAGAPEVEVPEGHPGGVGPRLVHGDPGQVEGGHALVPGEGCNTRVSDKLAYSWCVQAV